ncbi:hypothetical protein MA20_45410 [Bradyrhizobium japonicum]|uniref:Uncharacterized protein n=1 Tax=Bradyrhizobium japonicum TaxID=375 RepID=A0A0A3YHR0_BRAJP|nr:hypothetical protein MA20_45410 [Bradyrhizobium japonicum]
MTDGELCSRVTFPDALPSIFVGLCFTLGPILPTLTITERIPAPSRLVLPHAAKFESLRRL